MVFLLPLFSKEFSKIILHRLNFFVKKSIIPIKPNHLEWTCKFDCKLHGNKLSIMDCHVIEMQTQICRPLCSSCINNLKEFNGNLQKCSSNKFAKTCYSVFRINQLYQQQNTFELFILHFQELFTNRFTPQQL